MVGARWGGGGRYRPSLLPKQTSVWVAGLTSLPRFGEHLRPALGKCRRDWEHDWEQLGSRVNPLLGKALLDPGNCPRSR